MNNLKEKDIQNQLLICDVLLLTEGEYLAQQVELMFAYVAEFAGDDNITLIKLINSHAFEAWYVNAYNRRNWQFVHKKRLRSYKPRRNAGLRVSNDVLTLRSQYRAFQSISPIDHYPSQDVVKMILKETI